MKPEVKVCGVTDAAFAAAAARLGVDYIGTIFAERSPRRVDVGTAAAIAAAARAAADGAGRGGAVRIVGVFTSGAAEEISAAARAVPVDVVQLHGEFPKETAAALKADGFAVWLLDGTRIAETCAAADAILADGVSPGGESGGSGRRADWGRVAALKAAGRRAVLAGGIGPDDFAAAAATGADVIDLNSALETSPGVKSLPLLKKALAARRRRTAGSAGGGSSILARAKRH